MTSPYFIEGPALISFSGGRSSGFMLKKIIDAHDGTLPDNIHVVFANTGLEMPQTYYFIKECSRRWDVNITWLEWRKEKPFFEEVWENSYASSGEPFKMMIEKKKYLPNPTQRICTFELKVKTMRRYMKSLYPKSKKSDGWLNVVGLRADEKRRVASVMDEKQWQLGQSDSSCPMSEDNVTKFTVKDFWDSQDFDLNLPNVNGVTPHGNCTLCFLKGMPTLLGLIRENPKLADLWIEMEEMAPTANNGCGTFRKDRPSYKSMVDIVDRSPDIFEDMPDEPTIPCTCTD